MQIIFYYYSSEVEILYGVFALQELAMAARNGTNEIAETVHAARWKGAKATAAKQKNTKCKQKPFTHDE